MAQVVFLNEIGLARFVFLAQALEGQTGLHPSPKRDEMIGTQVIVRLPDALLGLWVCSRRMSV
jgi:hypothetical protein